MDTYESNVLSSIDLLDQSPSTDSSFSPSASSTASPTRSSFSTTSDVLSIVFTPQWHQSDFKGNILPSRVSLWLSNPQLGASSTAGVIQGGAPFSLEFYAFCSPTTNQSKKFVKMADVSLFDSSREQAPDNCISRCEPANWIDTINVSPLQRVETSTSSTGATTQMSFLLYRSKSEGRTNQLAYVKLYPGNKYKLEIRIARSSDDDNISKTERLAAFDGPSERGFDVATLASRGLTWHMGHARMVRSGSGGTESQGNIDESLITLDSIYLNGKSWDKYNMGHHTSTTMSLFDRSCAAAAANNDTFTASMLPAPLEIPVMTGAPMLPPPSSTSQWNFHTPFTQPTYSDATKEEKKNTFDLPSPAAIMSSPPSTTRSFLTFPSATPSTSLPDSTSSGIETRAVTRAISNKRKSTSSVPTETTPIVDAPVSTAAFKKNKVGAEFMPTPVSAGSDDTACPLTPTTPSGASICSTSTTGEVERMTCGLEEFVLNSMHQQAQEELDAMRRHQQREEAELLARLRQRHQMQEQELFARQRRALVSAMFREMGRVDPALSGLSVTPSQMAQITTARAFAPVTVDSLLQPDASTLPSPRSSLPPTPSATSLPSPSSSSAPAPAQLVRRVRFAQAPLATPSTSGSTTSSISTRASARAAQSPAPFAVAAPINTGVAARPAPIAVPLPPPIPSSDHHPSSSSPIVSLSTPIPSIGLTRLTSNPSMDEYGVHSTTPSLSSLFDHNGLAPLSDDTLIFSV